MKPASVNEYIDNFPEDTRAKLAELRGIIKEVLPETQEVLKWGNPAILDKDGMILAIFAGYK